MEGVTSAFLYGRLEGSTVKELGEEERGSNTSLFSFFLFSTNPGTCTETERLKNQPHSEGPLSFLFIKRKEGVKCLVSKISIGFEFTFRSI